MGIIKPKELNKLGYTDNVARSLAIELVAKHCKHHTQEEVFNILRDVHLHPERYKNDEVWGRLAEVLSPSKAVQTNYDIRESSIPYCIYGRENIDKLATDQMDMAMRLPVSMAGALMPDGVCRIWTSYRWRFGYRRCSRSIRRWAGHRLPDEPDHPGCRAGGF